MVPFILCLDVKHVVLSTDWAQYKSVSVAGGVDYHRSVRVITNFSRVCRCSIYSRFFVLIGVIGRILVDGRTISGQVGWIMEVFDISKIKCEKCEVSKCNSSPTDTSRVQTRKRYYRDSYHNRKQINMFKGYIKECRHNSVRCQSLRNLGLGPASAIKSSATSSARYSSMWCVF